MDTSEQYIKMCERAEEIQAIRKDRHHFMLKYGDYTYWNGGIALCSKDYDLILSNFDRVIWLPRQDQLQEMIDWDVNDMTFKLEALANFGVCRNPDASFEQLWLAFVMKEKYGKRWDGSDWVKLP